MKKSIFIVTAFVFWGCGNRKVVNNENRSLIHRIKVKKELSLIEKDWECDSIGIDKVCHPIKWKRESILKDMYLYHINEEVLPEEYFVILKYKVSSESYIFDYLKRIRNSIDSAKNVADYSIHELEYTDGHVNYFAEYQLILDSIEYKAFSTYTIYNNFLYDLTLKCKKQNSENYYNDYKAVLYNFSNAGQNIFSDIENLKGFSEIKLESL